MLRHLSDRGFYTRGYEPAHVQVTPEAVKAAVNLTEEWMKDKCLPDKATVLLSEAVSYWQDVEERARDRDPHRPIKQITPAEIAGCLYTAIKHTFTGPMLTQQEFIQQVMRAGDFAIADEGDIKENDL